MSHLVLRRVVCPLCVVAVIISTRQFLVADDLTEKQVLGAIEKAKQLLLKLQQADGSWSSVEVNQIGGNDTYVVGATSVALLALLNTEMSVADREIQAGLKWLRQQEPTSTYEISLMIQALAAAKDGAVDTKRVAALVRLLEEGQVRGGLGAGLWSYRPDMNGSGVGDPSNGQFAVLGLRDAQEMGVPVSLDTWRRARHHWLTNHNPDGGWGYSGGGRTGRQSSGSMTSAGIAMLVITEAMLKGDERETHLDGTPICCSERKPDKSLETACRWLGNNFAVRNNPGGENRWLLYYLYGLERAGRFSGRRFFVSSRGHQHDWYREGAEYLVSQQDPITGSWNGMGIPGGPAVAASFPLIFLSKGLAPVLINKLEYGRRDPKHKQVVGIDWNRHPDDARNLTQLISNLPKWPRLLNWQTIDAANATVNDLMQAPILYISGSEVPYLSMQEVGLLKEYVMQGGFIFAVNNCQSARFDEGFRDLVRQMFPPSENQLRKLTAAHPVFRSEFNLLDETTGAPAAELWGLDFGCRTSIIYTPEDLSCLWDKSTSFSIPGRSKPLLTMIARATRVGVNVVAYVTGRELLDKMQRQEILPVNESTDRIERDLLQISKIRYEGDWDAAPKALQNLLAALNKTSQMAVSTRQRDMTLIDSNLFRYPIAYMHGRYDFALGKNEQEKLRDYITQGGVLFSDACCGVAEYDRSFRRLMEQLFPDNPLKRIPVDHEIFTDKVGYELKTVKLRGPDPKKSNAATTVAIRDAEPFLEGIEVEGRFVVIYSKYDISCALHRQADVPCIGYMYLDAVKIGANVILYALLQ